MVVAEAFLELRVTGCCHTDSPVDRFEYAYRFIDLYVKESYDI